MSQEIRNKIVLRRLLDEVVVGGRMSLVEELVSPDFVNHSVMFTGEKTRRVGIDNFKEDIQNLRQAFPDLTLEITQLVTDDDKIVIFLVIEGTHQGAYLGIAPTGKKVKVPSMTIFRLENGKFAERWNLVDRYGLLEQLGALPGRHGQQAG